MIHIRADEQSNPPDVVSITPAFINLGRSVTMTALGTDLLAAQVTINAPGVVISNIIAEKTQITFRITAALTATIGQVAIDFTTGLGSDSFMINVAEVLPDLFTNPTPIAIAVSAQSSTIGLRFSEPRPSDEIYTISMTDPLTATVTQSTLTVLAGQTTAQLDITGIALGSTELKIVLASKFYFFSFPVFVTPVFAGGTDIYSTGVGVFLETANSLVGNQIRSDAVGVLLEDSANGLINPIKSVSPAVGVFMESTTGSLMNPILSNSVGVFLRASDGSLGNLVLSPLVGAFLRSSDGSLGNLVLSPLVGVTLGPLLESVAPKQLNPGDNIDLTISGFNLEAVSSITVIPTGSINLGVFSINPNGLQITLPITVDPNALTGNYELIIETPQGFVRLPSGHNLSLTIQ